MDYARLLWDGNWFNCIILRFFSQEEKAHSYLTILLGGVLFGAALATKINLVLIPISILVSVYIGNLNLKTMTCHRIITSGIIGLFFWVLVLSIYYWPNPFEALKWFDWFYGFATNPGGEQSFWENLLVFAPKISQGADYSYFITTVISFILCILSVIRIKNLKQLVLYSVLTGFSSIILLIQRLAGTTLWEVSVLLLVLSGILLMKADKGPLKIIILYLPWVFHLSLKLHEDCKKLNFSKELLNSSAEIISIHREVSSKNSGVLCLFSSNNNTCGSIEEGILKGFSEFPSWHITNGKKILKRYYPMLSFTQDLEKEGTKFCYILFITGNIQEKQKLLDELRNFNIQKNWHLKTFPWWIRDIFLLEKSEKK